MLRPHGYVEIIDPEPTPGVELAWDTITCIHCQRIVRVKPGTGATVYLLWKPSENRWVEEMGAMCGKCNKPVCLPCCDLGVCLPWEKQMEIIEAAATLGVR